MSSNWRAMAGSGAEAERRRAVGSRDFARRLRSRVDERPVWAAFVAGLIGGALLLVVLRVDIIRMRYQLAQALETEAELRGQIRESVVAERRLRHPARLAEIASELGFDRPSVVVEIDALPAADGDAEATDELPVVAAGPESQR